LLIKGACFRNARNNCGNINYAVNKKVVKTFFIYLPLCDDVIDGNKQG